METGFDGMKEKAKIKLKQSATEHLDVCCVRFSRCTWLDLPFSLFSLSVPFHTLSHFLVPLALFLLARNTLAATNSTRNKRGIFCALSLVYFGLVAFTLRHHHYCHVFCWNLIVIDFRKDCTCQQNNNTILWKYVSSCLEPVNYVCISY